MLMGKNLEKKKGEFNGQQIMWFGLFRGYQAAWCLMSTVEQDSEPIVIADAYDIHPQMGRQVQMLSLLSRMAQQVRQTGLPNHLLRK